MLSLWAMSLLSPVRRQEENSQFGRGKCLEELVQACWPDLERYTYITSFYIPLDSTWPRLTARDKGTCHLAPCSSRLW